MITTVHCVVVIIFLYQSFDKRIFSLIRICYIFLDVLLVLCLFAGTGYLTACFALMVGPQGRAVGVEHIPELVASSIQNLEKSSVASLLKEGSLSVYVGGMFLLCF